MVKFVARSLIVLGRWEHTEMQLRSHDAYERDKRNFSRNVITFAERWADNIEALVLRGERLVDVARAAAFDASTSMRNTRITPVMYGKAVDLLRRHWEHGHQLLMWSNCDLLGPDKGAAATNRGRCVNPRECNAIRP